LRQLFSRSFTASGRRGVLGRGASSDGERGGAAEPVDLVEPDAAEAKHRVARRLGKGQRHKALP